MSLKSVTMLQRWTKEWLALLSTDTELADEDIARIYGKRWGIDFDAIIDAALQCVDLSKNKLAIT